MTTYEKAKAIAIADTIPDGKVYCSGDAGDFYIFIIVPKNFPTDIPDAMFGVSYTAVDKKDGRVWVCHVTDPRLKNVKKIAGPNKTK